MKYFITSSKDATVYDDHKSQNTGIDQILEVSKWRPDTGYDRISRAFIQFDFTEISKSISNGEITNPTFSLEMKSTKLRELPLEFDLEILPISHSWDMGLGKRQDNPLTVDGVSWLWTDASSSVSWSNEGGDFITSQTASFHYNQYTVDLNKDITNIVNNILNGALVNNGFVIKFPSASEADGNHYGSVNFFSSETNTIYKPKISVEWYDNSISTGSLNEVADTDDPFVTITNLKAEYKINNTYKFRLHSREQFPSLTFTSGSVHSVNHFLPTASKYSIVDNITDEVIVPFNSNTLLSVDSNGNYFKQTFKGWEAERYYRILFKIDDGDGDVSIVDKNLIFKLVE